MYILIKGPAVFADKAWGLGNRMQSKMTPRFWPDQREILLAKKAETKAVTN